MGDMQGVVTIAPSAREAESIARIIDGAGRVFLRDGLAGSSVDDIAREAGVSKATLYRHFDDKTALYIAWLLREVQAMEGQTLSKHTVDEFAPIDIVLDDLAHSFLRLTSDGCGRDMFRTAVAESARLPEIGKAFYQAIMGTGQCFVADLLRKAVERGELDLPDPNRAARQFISLVRAENFLEAVLLADFALDPETLDSQAKAAVRFFLAGVRGG